MAGGPSRHAATEIPCPWDTVATEPYPSYPEGKMMDGMSEQQGTHFWFMTIQVPLRNGYHMSSCQGSFSPSPDMTRLDAFNELFTWVRERYPETSGGNVIAFDVQPNKL